MFKRFLDALNEAINPFWNAEIVIQRFFWEPGVSQALHISLVRKQDDLKLVFALPRDSETGVVNPVALAPEKLDEMIAFLQECRERVVGNAS